MSDATGTQIRANLEAVRARLADAARRAGRRAEAVRLVAVSKTADLEQIREAIAAGVTVLGENRVQEARAKVAVLGHPVAWHLIGHLQSNKVRDAVACFDLIESVDRLPLAEAISARAVQAGRRIPVLVQVNVADEVQKSGLPPAALRDVLPAVGALPGLELRGLMGIPPVPRDAEDSRVHYREMRKLFDLAQGWELGPGFCELSMGMSGDFEVAVEEGATIVRVGTAIFGPRRA